MCPTWSFGRGGNPSNQIFLFGLVFRADGKRIQNPQRQGILQSLILTATHVSLPENLHSDDCFPGRPHLLEHGDHDLRLVIHVRTDRIYARKVHFYPRRFGCGAQRLNGVAGTAVGTDNAFLLGF
jgi:hypothetical protein